jgi:hypothetical protein
MCTIIRSLLQHPRLRLKKVIKKSNRGKPDIVFLNIWISVGIGGRVSVQHNYNSVAHVTAIVAGMPL